MKDVIKNYLEQMFFDLIGRGYPEKLVKYVRVSVEACADGIISAYNEVYGDPKV